MKNSEKSREPTTYCIALLKIIPYLVFFPLQPYNFLLIFPNLAETRFPNKKAGFTLYIASSAC